MAEKTYDGQYTMQRWWELSAIAEEKSFGSYREMVKEGDVIFDIGANRGRKVYIFLALKAAKVIAVDPLYTWRNEFVPEFFWKFGKDKRVVSVARAVSNEREMMMQVNRFMPYVSSIDVPWMTVSAHGGEKQPYYRKGSLIQRKVQGITLDGLINIYGMPDFLKVDVEGHENTALKTLGQPVPALNMEFHRDWIPREAIAHLDGLAAYEWNYCLNNIGVFVAPEWMESKRLLGYMEKRLTDSGPGSWGDLYARRVERD